MTIYCVYIYISIKVTFNRTKMTTINGEGSVLLISDDIGLVDSEMDKTNCIDIHLRQIWYQI